MDRPALAFRDVTFAYAQARGVAEPGVRFGQGIDVAPGALPEQDLGAASATSPKQGGAGPVPSVAVLRHASLEVPEGAFALLVGATGSGKSTLLRLAKPELSPAGALSGAVEAFGADVRGLSPVESARACGYVFQGPEAQIVCDTVWHELSLGLENLGVPEPAMRRRVAETCAFLGIEPWFRAHTSELSGGQRQVVALAATLAMRPRILLLDEPTSMLDPVAERAFLSLLFQANRELGITVVVATHAPARLAGYATMAAELVDGALRTRDLAGLAHPAPLDLPEREPRGDAPEALGVSGVWHRYAQGARAGSEGRWVLRGLDLSVDEGEVRALVGSNGSGKSTLLSVIAGIERPVRGRVASRYADAQAMLPQSPRALLSHETAREELMAWSSSSGAYGAAEVDEALARLGLRGCPGRHPFDLSGGQQQLLALEKLLLVRPRLLLLDEPTKGLDDAARLQVARRVLQARAAGATVLVATHDLEFVRVVADSVSLLFDGQVACTEQAGRYVREAWA